MGATTSVGNILSENIYISCIEDDKYAELLYKELIHLGYNTVKCDIKNNKDEFLDVKTFSENITRIISESLCIFVCLREESLQTFNQVIEINHILDSSKNVIYIMTDKNYTPLNKKYINGIIKDKLWFPAYDGNTVSNTLNKITSLLKSFE